MKGKIDTLYRTEDGMKFGSETDALKHRDCLDDLKNKLFVDLDLTDESAMEYIKWIKENITLLLKLFD